MPMHVVRMTVAAGFIVLCTLLPFLPGRHDAFAVPLSAMAQIVGWAGLLLVPIGAAWLAYEMRRRSSRSDTSGDKGYIFATAALMASAVVGLAVCLGALAFSGWSLGVAALALWAYLVRRGMVRTKQLRHEKEGPGGVLALYLVVVPIGVALAQWALAEPITEFSRNRAIANSARLIADIEHYRATHGKYPLSLLSLWEDYSPSIIGISRYQYEQRGDAYNLLFEHPTLIFGTRELVVYNPRDEQVATSHNMDLLEFTGAALDVRRGYYAVRSASRPHWKYFWFD